MTSMTASSKAKRASADASIAPPATPEALRAYIPYLVNRLSNRISADQNRFLSEIGLNNAILRTLSVLHIYETLTVNEISVLAVIEQSSASRTIDQMLDTGLVTRRSGAQDQRRREVALTKEGLALLRKVWPKVAARAETLRQDISQEDIAICARVLSRMIDNVRQHDI